MATAWAARYVDPGAMIYHDGAFHMFINGFNSYPGVTSIGYATSPDGYTWSLASKDPVFTSDKVTYAQAAIFVSSVLVGDDGTWTLYFYAVDLSHPIAWDDWTGDRAEANRSLDARRGAGPHGWRGRRVG